MTIILKNLNNEEPVEEYPWQVRIDRGYSVLANPYKMKTKSDTERQLCVARYKRWLWQCCEQKGKILAELFRLYELHKTYHKLELFCWCSPKLCHGNVIKEFLELTMKEDCYDNFRGNYTR